MASTPRWGGLRLEPYDPDAVDADNDGIVQEGTAWERPAGTKILDAFGREINKGRTSNIRPAGLRYVDSNGKDVDYTPRRPKQEAPGAQTALAQLGAPTIGAQAGTIGTPGIPPVAPKLPTITEPKKVKKAVKKSTIGSSIGDQGAPTILDLNVPKPFIPPKPELTVNNPDVPLMAGIQGPQDIRTPTAFDLDMGVVLWREGQTGNLRSELENVLAGTDVEWDGTPDDRARMAAIMNAVADAPLTTVPLYRGERVLSKERFDELAALKPGDTFTTDMRGYGTDSGTAVTFAYGAPYQVIYEVESGARALRLSDAVPMSRHRDEDVLDEGAEELDKELFQTISEEDEHLALGKYEVVSAELTLVGPPGAQKQRLSVKLRQTESLGKPEGGWDAPQPAAPATPDPEVFAAETQDIIDNAITPASSQVPAYASARALEDREQEVLRVLTDIVATDPDSPAAEMYRERLAAIREARAEQLLPNHADLHDPKDADQQRNALESWVSGDGTGYMREHYDGIRDGAESWPDRWDDTARGTTAYDAALRWRAEMAAMMQAYSDGAWEQDQPLYRGEALEDVSLEEVLSTLYPVGREFEMPMRGFSTEEYTAQGFLDRSYGDAVNVMLVFDEDSPATALPLYEMYDELREWDSNDEPIEFLDDQTTKYLYRESEHLVAGQVRVKAVTVNESGVVVVSLEHVVPLKAPDEGFEAPPAPSTQEVLAAMSQKPVPPLESALARIAKQSDTKTDGTRQATYELADARATLEDARVTGNTQRVAEYTAIVAALEAELVRQKSRPYSDDVKPATIADKAAGLEQWVDGWDSDFRPHFEDILAGVASADTRHEAGMRNGEPWPDDVNDRSWLAFLTNRRRMAGLMNAYVDNGTTTEMPIYRGERLDETSAAVLTDIYPVGREFVLPMHSFTAQEYAASLSAKVPSGSSSTGVRITLRPGAKSLDVARIVENDEFGTEFPEATRDMIDDDQEHLVAGSVRVVSSTLAEDGKVDVVLEMVEPLGYDPNGEEWR